MLPEANKTLPTFSEEVLDAMDGCERQVARYLERWGEVCLRFLDVGERKAARLLVCKGMAFQRTDELGRECVCA